MIFKLENTKINNYVLQGEVVQENIRTLLAPCNLSGLYNKFNL